VEYKIIELARVVPRRPGTFFWTNREISPFFLCQTKTGIGFTVG